MKKKTNVHLLPEIAIAVLLAWTIISPSYSNEKDAEFIAWNDEQWDYDGDNIDKDLFYPPITAYIESSTLYIQHEKPDGDLNIAIVSGKFGRVVWEQVYPEAATSLVAIPLDALPAGEYSLQVVNEWGGYLCGTFQK